MDFYFDEEGTRFLTSHFLQKRGHCCKSSCLHCPYGHTLNTVGLSFTPYVDEKKIILKTLNENGYNLEKNFVNDLLSDALNEKTKEIDIEVLIHEGIQILSLKTFYCGFYVPKTGDLFLNLNFKYQGITKELVETQFAQ